MGVLNSLWAWIQFWAGALERVCLPVGGLGYSSTRVHLNGCAYQLAAFGRCAYQLAAFATTARGAGLPVIFKSRAMFVKNDARRATHNIMLT